MSPLDAPTQVITLDDKTEPDLEPEEDPFDGQMTFSDFVPEEEQEPEPEEEEGPSWEEQLIETRKEKIRDFQIKQNRENSDFRYMGEEEPDDFPGGVPAEDRSDADREDDPDNSASEKRHFTGDFTDFEQVEDIRAELDHRYRGGRFRLWLAAAAELLLLWSEGTVAVYGQPTLAPSLFVILNAVLFGAMIALLYPMLRQGVTALLHKKPNADTVPAVTSAMVALHTLLQFFHLSAVESGEAMLLTAVGGLLLLLCGLGHLLKNNRVRRNFEAVCKPGEKIAASMIQDEHSATEIGRHAVVAGIPQVAFFRPVSFLDDFLANSYMDDGYDQLMRRYLPIGAAGAVVIGIVSGIAGGSFWTALTGLVASLCAILPAASLALNLPLLRECRRLLKTGNLLCGFAAAERFGKLDGVALDVSDLYLQNSVALHGIRTFGDARIDEVIMDAASVAVRTDGPLAGLFLRIIEDKTEILQPVENLVFEQDMGFSGWVGGRRVLVGNRKLLENHGVYTPSSDYERKYKKDGRELVYLSIAGELSAMFIISYLTDPIVAEALHGLQKSKISLLIRSCDPNVTEQSICVGFQLDDYYVDLLSASAGRLYDNLRHTDIDRVSAGAAVNGTVEGIADLLIGCRRLRTGGMIAMILQIAFGIIGGIWCLASAFSGGVAGVPLLLFVGIAALLSVLPSFFQR
ncbi:MAG: cation-translocating P-type ATPase [Clostridia bacterium]|nr:cation-translocating P-type ATPase [Clostridia bacterium]